MFPDYLDGAKVLEYTEKGHFGFVTDYDENDTPMEKEICYFAIARYEGDSRFYLFGCDSTPEVFDDSLWDSPEECKDVISWLLEDTVWYKK